MSCSNLLSVKAQRPGLNTFPATLNSLSRGAEDAGRAKYLDASLLKLGYLIWFSFQNSNGYTFSNVTSPLNSGVNGKKSLRAQIMEHIIQEYKISKEVFFFKYFLQYQEGVE